MIEVEPFGRHAASALSANELEEFKYFIAQYPENGEIIPGTNGVRKVRWAIDGKGKSGGVRVIYYYHDINMPLFLITIYRKAQKDNLTKAQTNAMAKLVDILIDQYK